MRKPLQRLSLMAALSALLSACAVFSQGLPPAPKVGGLRPAAMGTGFFVANNRVLTNFHVVGDCKAVTIGNNIEGWEVDASFLAGDMKADLAVLEANAQNITPARFRTIVDTNTRQSWAIVGYPDNAFPAWQAELDKIFIDPIDFTSGAPTIPFSGEVRHGNSGSPVLDDRGAVVGVVFGMIQSDKVFEKTGYRINDIGVAVPGRIVLDFLRKNDIAFRPALPARSRTEQELLLEARDYVRQVTCYR